MIAGNLMRTGSATLMALLTIGCAYHSPDAPSPATPISATAPFSLTLGATVGMGVDAGRATVTAKVQNVNGAVLPGVTVQFTTDVGTLSAASVVTGANGTATTTITAAQSAAITATAGTLTTHTLVASQPVVVPPTPPPPPDPAPDPIPVGPLSVTLTATDVILGTQTVVSAQVRNGPPQSLNWSFGDGATFAGISTTTAHTYGAVGSYLIGVTVTDTSGRTASGTTITTVNAVPPPPPPPPAPGPAYSVTLAASPTSILAGGSSTLTATVALSNGATAPTGFAWDCDNDGTAEFTNASNTQACTYPTAGTITSKVTVTGSATASATTTVTVTVPPPPTVTISCSTGVHLGSASTCVASATVNGAAVPSSRITQVVWDFGDSTTATSLSNISPPHTYGTTATFTVFGTAMITGVAGTVTGSTTTTILP